MTFLDAHASEIALTLLFAVALVLLDRAYTRTARAQREAHRAIRAADRRAYCRRLAALRGLPFDDHAAQAERLNANEPIPYHLTPEQPLNPYRPDFGDADRVNGVRL